MQHFAKMELVPMPEGYTAETRCKVCVFQFDHNRCEMGRCFKFGDVDNKFETTYYVYQEPE